MTRPLALLSLAALALAAPAEGVAGDTAMPVAEIVTFRLVDGADPAAFVRAAEALTPFLAGTGAVLSRTLSRDDSGLWTDHVLWTSRSAAEAAAAALMQDPVAQPFLAMIAPDGLTLRHAAVHLQTE